MNRRMAASIVASLLTLMVANSVNADGSAYTFSVNGKPVQPIHYSLRGDDSPPAPGDVIYIGSEEFNYGGIFLTLGEERECRFVTLPSAAPDVTERGLTRRTSVRDGRVFLELPNGRHQVIAASVTWTILKQTAASNERAEGKKENEAATSSDEITVNPLDDMSPDEIHGLWGIYLNQWPQGIENKLAYVDPNRVCIAVTDFAGAGGKGSSFFGGPEFPPIPATIRYLIVRDVMSPGLRDYSHLGRFRDLAFLIFQSGGSQERLDFALISENTSLRYLDISRGHFRDRPKLASFAELRFLDITGLGGVDNLDFVKNMRYLRTLIIDRTWVSSLSPLDDSTSIYKIHASPSGVRDLPKGDLPSLKTINLVSSKVDARTVERFRKDHPDCIVQYGWMDSLRQTIQGTTRLRIRTGGTCHRHIEDERTLADITQPEEIRRFMDGIHIDEAQSGFSCACCGNPTLEFYAGDRLLAMIGYHHGRSLRWAEGEWPNDGLLTGPSQVFVISWLAQHDVEGPRQAQEAQQRQKTEEERIERRYADLIPAQVLADVLKIQRTPDISWNNDPRGEKRRKRTAEAFIHGEKDPETSAEMYLKVLGVKAAGPWDTFHEFEYPIAADVLPRFKGPELAKAIRQATREDEGALGAARWLLGCGGWRNLDESDRADLLPPLTERALQHHHMGTRKRVMDTLSEIHSDWAAESLRGMLSRPTDPNWVPFTARYGPKIDLADGRKIYAEECSDAVWAAFCLAMRGDRPSLPAIRKLASEAQDRDKELLEQALQLLQDRNQGTSPTVD